MSSLSRYVFKDERLRPLVLPNCMCSTLQVDVCTTVCSTARAANGKMAASTTVNVLTVLLATTDVPTCTLSCSYSFS